MDKEQRRAGLARWAADQLVQQGVMVGHNLNLESASDDASFRRYFRARHEAPGYVFVDAPPDKEANPEFIDVAGRLAAAGVEVPVVYAANLSEGYLLLSDLGNGLLLDVLRDSDESATSQLYKLAFEALFAVSRADASGLARYDESRLRREMDLFPQWFLAKQLQFDMGEQEQKLLLQVFETLINNALEQPNIFVHRDFHARNLMPRKNRPPAVLDFQDAVQGPVTYDLVSLLKDCYWRLPRSQVEAWVSDARSVLAPATDDQTFLRWFDLMGMQRHLKCAGIFSRLNLRDGKPGYLNDIPLVMDYILEVGELYPEIFSNFTNWLRRDVMPRMGTGEFS